MAVTNKILSPSTFLTYSLGCRTNQAEISAISSQLTASNMEVFNKKKHLSPDLVLINTCAVTLKAERESRKAIRHFKRLYPKAKIITLGCATKFIKDTNLVIENNDKENTLKIIFKKFPNLKTPRRWSNEILQGAQQDSLYTQYSQSGRALVKIQDGCNNFCAYCIVPYLRGKPKSTSSLKIIYQINKLTNEGIKEIVLCGTNLSLYGGGASSLAQNDHQQKCYSGQVRESLVNLTYLLKKILKETNGERISLSSIEPEYLCQNEEFVNLFIKESRLSKYFHLALQSGSQNTINAMGRKTNLKKLLEALQSIKAAAPEFTFRADIIVGFPTETEKNFQETLDFINEAPITFCHIFPYSIRPGTLAEKMIKNKIWKDVPVAIKKARVKEIKNLVKQIQKREAQKLVGKILPCLVIKKFSDNYETIANNSWPVVITHQSSTISNQTLIGKILPVKIIGIKNSCLLGSKL